MSKVQFCRNYQITKLPNYQIPNTNYRALAGHQLSRPRGRLDHRVDQRYAQAALFQFDEAVDGASGGGGDRVFQQGGVMSGFQSKLGRAEERLGGEGGGQIARQSALYAGFGERFKDD